MPDQAPANPERLARQITALALRHTGAALVQIAGLLQDTAADAGEDCGCDPDDEVSPAIAEHTWVPRFATDIHVGDLLSVGVPLRAVRVTEKRDTEHRSPFGGAVETFTFLVVDVVSGEPASIEAARNEPLRVAVVAPESAEGLTGGAS